MAPSSPYVQVAESRDERRYRKVLSCVELTKNFFFSYTWPLWSTMQANLLAATPNDPWTSMFVWNNYLTRHASPPTKQPLAPTGNPIDSFGHQISRAAIMQGRSATVMHAAFTPESMRASEIPENIARALGNPCRVWKGWKRAEHRSEERSPLFRLVPGLVHVGLKL